ncbi:MAG: alpha/beta hydrolase [Pseudomonadota bacterium]
MPNQPQTLASDITFEQWRHSGYYFRYAQYDIFYRYHLNLDSEKPNLLLLHGSPTASMDWHKVWGSLSQHFNLITLDFLGYGSSDKPKNHNYTIMEQANLCEFLMQKLKLTQCSVIAHDYGATVLQELLARQNTHQLNITINQAVILNSGIFIEGNQPMLIQRLMIGPLFSLIGALNNRWMFRIGWQRLFYHTLSTDAFNEVWRMICYKQGRSLLPKLQRYLFERLEYRDRWRNALIHAQQPLLYICGDFSPVSGEATRKYYERHMPHQRTIALNVGHYPHLEAPDLVVSHSVAFLNTPTRLCCMRAQTICCNRFRRIPRLKTW